MKTILILNLLSNIQKTSIARFLLFCQENKRQEYSYKMDITFYDTNFEVYNDTFLGGFCAMDYVYVQPGIQQLQIDYILSIKQKDLEQLPNGRYDLCVAECNSEAQVEYNHSLLIMRNGEMVIRYTANTIILNQTINFVISCICIVFATNYFYKKIRKNYK